MLRSKIASFLFYRCNSAVENFKMLKSTLLCNGYFNPKPSKPLSPLCFSHSHSKSETSSQSKHRNKSPMDSTPPSRRSESRLRFKSASRLARLTRFDGESEDASRLSLDLVPFSPKVNTPSPSSRPQNPRPLHEILLLSSSPLRKSKTHLVERIDMEEEAVESTGSRRRCKNRNGSAGLSVCASPRNGRRTRRRLEAEIREERDSGMVEEMGKVRKRRHSGRSKKDKLSLVPSVPFPEEKNHGDLCNLDRLGELITDLIMWNDVAKSSLWFGLGSLCLLSSSFARGISFSIFSLMSQLGLLFLGLSFFSNSVCQRSNIGHKREFKLKEDDILRATRVILPTLNLAISKTTEIFSGEPTMTLKVAPFLLIGAGYGHLMTLRRLCTLVECLQRWVIEAWGACSHKKIVAASAATAFWNLTAIRTRILAAFIFVVLLRHNRQHLETKLEAGEAETGKQEQQQQQALAVVETVI